MKVPRIEFQELEGFLAEDSKGGGNPENWVEIDTDLPAGCFALDLQDMGMSSRLGKSGAAIFSRRFGEALDGFYLLKKSGGGLLFCRLVRTESRDQESPRFRPSRRKSFMTPTPLHVPGSRVSPIPDFTHAVFYLEPVGEKRIEIVPAGQADCLFPLVHLKRAPGGN